MDEVERAKNSTKSRVRCESASPLLPNGEPSRSPIKGDVKRKTLLPAGAPEIFPASRLPATLPTFFV